MILIFKVFNNKIIISVYLKDYDKLFEYTYFNVIYIRFINKNYGLGFFKHTLRLSLYIFFSYILPLPLIVLSLLVTSTCKDRLYKYGNYR